MKRKKLLALPVAPLVTEHQLEDTVEFSQKRWDGRRYTKKINRYIYRAFWDESTGEKVLVVDIFTAGSKKLVVRSFTDTGKGFFAWRADVNKVSDAGMDYIIDFYVDGEYFSDAESDIAIEKLTGRDIQGYYRPKQAIGKLGKYHKQLKDERLKEHYRKIKESISQQMLEIRELPKDVYRWINNDLMKSSRYIIYEYNGKKTTKGYCTHCQQEVEVTEPRNRTAGRCPHCHSRIQYRSKKQWKHGNGFVNEARFVYFQPISKGICVRGFKVYKRFQTDSKLGCLDLHEDIRVFFDRVELDNGFYLKGGTTWKYDEFRQTGTYCFQRYSGVAEYIGEHRIYPTNLNKLLRGSNERSIYVDYCEIARKCGKIEYRQLIDKPQAIPQIEYLMKLKLYNLASDMMKERKTDWIKNENNIKKALGITKDDIAFLQKLNPTPWMLKLYKAIKAQGGTVNLEALKWLNENVQGSTDLLGVLRWVRAGKTVKYLEEQKGFIKDYHGTYYWESKYKRVLSLWKDYLRNANLLQMDMKSDFVLMPKNLIEAHDRAYKEVQDREEHHTFEQIAAMEESLNKQFYYETKKFLIRAPHDGKEIKDEGTALHHCVGNYVKSMALGDTIILFVRRLEEPDKPCYTVELDPDTWKIVQYRGFGNNMSPEHPVDPEVTKFLEKWKQKKLVMQNLIQVGA